MRIIMFAITVTLILSGCGTPAAGEIGDGPPVRWGVFKNYQPVFIAKAKGFFTEEKVEVEFVGAFTSGPAIVQAAATNNVDAGHSAISGIVNAVNSNIEIIGIADSQTEFQDAPLMQWFVLAESPIKSVADLRGKKIGVNSLSGSFFYTVLEALKQQGLAKEEVEFVVMPHHNQEQALRSGQIDVAGIIDPYTVHIQKEGGVRILFRAVDILGEVQFSHVFFRKDFVAKHPETVRRFLRAYNRAIEFIATHPEEASRIMAEQIGISADLVDAHRYTNNAEVRLKDVQFWIEMMRQGGELEDNGRLKAEDVATTEFTQP